MIGAMTYTNDNESNQLAFPIQITAENEQQSDDELSAEMRVRIAQAVNRVAAGEDTMRPELVGWINRVNALLMRGGYDPVPVDFRSFEVDQTSKLCLVNSMNT